MSEQAPAQDESLHFVVGAGGHVPLPPRKRVSATDSPKDVAPSSDPATDATGAEDSESVELQILAYRESSQFKGKLSSIRDDSSGWKMADRQALLEMIEKRTCALSLDYLDLVEVALSQLEAYVVSSERGAMLTGVSSALMSDETVRNLLETIRIKRFGSVDGFVSGFGPELQLLFAGAMVCFKVMKTNAMKVYPPSSPKEARRDSSPRSPKRLRATPKDTPKDTLKDGVFGAPAAVGGTFHTREV